MAVTPDRETTGASPSPAIRVGVDIGGTFTDVALRHPGGTTLAKALTDHAEPERVVIDAVLEATARAGATPGDIRQVIHGTTLVTNALIERRGAKLAFITTEGFRDVVEMRSENRFEQYDLNIELPKPLVPRKDRFTIAERMSAEGEVLLTPNPDEIESVIARICDGGYEAVAVGFLHAYANPAHEQAVAAAMRAAAPGLSVSISSVVSPQMREFERFNTVIANAYVRPRVAAYLGRLAARLRAEGIDAPLLAMHSGGGLIGVETAAREPVRLLESGPAGGAIFAADLTKAHGIDRALGFDMGGTTAKICLIEDGAPKTANTFETARTYRFKKGSGMPLSTPVVEMVEIGAGGGSIAHVDDMGQIRVGPRSAGSNPGPACYRRGGEEPTVSDANLILGRIDPGNFAGGEIPLSPELSERAVTERICGTVGLDLRDAAFGVTETVDENMANAARMHAVENGRDIEDFTVIAFGGGAPLHACRLCEKLGVETLIVPPGAGVGSAIGFLKAPFSYEASKGLFQRLDRFDPEAVNDALSALEGEARAFVRASAGDDAATAVRLTAYMRYSGQGYEIPVALPYRRFTAEDRPAIRGAFEEAYRALFGRIIDGLEIEIANWSLVAASAPPDAASAPPTPSPERRPAGSPVEAARIRRFYDAARRETVEAVELDRAALTPGATVPGPAVVVERDTATVVTSGYTVTGQGDGSLLLRRKPATKREAAA